MVTGVTRPDDDEAAGAWCLRRGGIGLDILADDTTARLDDWAKSDPPSPGHFPAVCIVVV